jgi:hypothetical protein
MKVYMRTFTSRVFTNLFSQFTLKGSVDVSISVDRSDEIVAESDHVCIIKLEVSDTGIGLSKVRLIPVRRRLALIICEGGHRTALHAILSGGFLFDTVVRIGERISRVES